jgi:hypothetical protein
MRIGSGRWGPAAEERFLVGLATSGSIRKAAAAAGFSEETVHRRRRKDKRLAAAWDAAVETGKARVQAYLVEAAARTFDPDELPEGEDPGPTVTISEAIHISRMKSGSGSGESKALAWQEESEIGEAEVEAARENILRKLKLLHERYREEKLAEGWSEDGEYLIPPGWARVQEGAETPFDFAQDKREMEGRD